MSEDPSGSITAAAQTQFENPTGDATQQGAGYVTAAMAAAQLLVSRAAAKNDAKATQIDEGAQGTRRPETKDPFETAREVYGPMLTRDRGRNASSEVAVNAWDAALPYANDHRDAAKAATRAEDRLRVLHPDAMARYDALRGGLDHVAAMREVVPLVSAEIDRRPDTQPLADSAADKIPTARDVLVDVAEATTGASAETAEVRHVSTVNAALGEAAAASVLADEAWPKLAQALDQVEAAGHDPRQLLADVAQQREMSSAKSPAEVLHHRFDQQSSAAVPPPGAVASGAEVVPAREAGPAQIAAQSFPRPLGEAQGAPVQPNDTDQAQVAVGLGLAREADTLHDSARDEATTPDDRSTTRVDEHHEGLVAAVPLDNQAAASLERANSLLAEGASATSAVASPAVAASSAHVASAGAPSTGASLATAPTKGQGANPVAVASQSFPTPLAQASASQASAAVATKPAAATAAKVTQTKTAGRRS